MKHEIRDMIQTFDLSASPDLMTSRILDILTAMNDRIVKLEADASSFQTEGDPE